MLSVNHKGISGLLPAADAQSRILAIADAFDAMLSERPYRRALTYQETLAELRKGAGTQFDPALVETFLNLQIRV